MAFDSALITDPARVAAARAAMHFITPPDDDLVRYCCEIARLTKSEMAFVTLVFAESHHVVAEWGFPKDGLIQPGEREGTFDKTGCAYLVAAREPIHFTDTHNFELLKECLNFKTIRSYSAAPLYFQDQIVGAFGVCDTYPREIAPKHMDRLIQLAAEVSADLKAREH